MSLPLCQRPIESKHFIGQDAPINTGQWLAMAHSLVAQLPPGDEPLVNLCGRRSHFACVLAAGLMMERTVLLPGSRAAGSLAELGADYPGAVAITDDDRLELLIDTPWTLQAFAVAVPAASAAPEIPTIDPSHLAAQVFTSGTTGKPKPIDKPWRTLHASSVLNANIMYGGLERPQIVATVVAQHMWGLEASVLAPWFCNAVVHPGRPFFPQDIADALAALQAPRVLVTTPVHLKALLNAGIDIPPLARVLSATAPLSAEVAAQCQRQTGAQMLEIYGSSETGSLAYRDPITAQPWHAFNAFALHPEGTQLTVSAAHLPIPVTLGDHIAVAGRRFSLLGRNSDMVNIGGKRGSLADLNARLNAIEGVIDGVIVQSNGRDAGRLTALVAAPELGSRDIREALRHQVDSVFVPRPIVIVDALPRNEAGKLPRDAVLAALAKHRAVS